MLLDYAIIKLSESKTTKGGFKYCIITERGGGSLKCLCMIMGEGRELALWWHKQICFLQSEIVVKLSPLALLKIVICFLSQVFH